MSPPDVLIVGAGPAGSTAAILLAQAGARVVLLDKARFPREKLCGEFLSPEAVEILALTGVLEHLAPRAGRAREVRLTDPRGRTVKLPVPLAGALQGDALGLSRWDMDEALVRRAESLGVVTIEGFEVRGALFSEGRLAGLRGHQRGAHGERSYSAPFVIAADGRDSTVARLISPGEFRGRSSPRFGLKAHFRNLPGFGGAVELHYVRGGYVGLHDIGGGRVNVCALLDRSVAGAIPRDPEAIVRRVFFQNPEARRRLERAERISDWLAVGSLVFRAERPVRAGALFLGDAAGTIDPFAGEGMSMALRSAQIAAEEILLGTTDGGSLVASRYERRWTREFSRRIALCRALGRLAIRPVLQAPLMGILAMFPGTGRVLSRGTRTGIAAPPPTGIQ